MILAKRPLLRRWLMRTGLAVAAMALTVLLLLWAATGPLGRWAVMQFADGREVARGLVIDLDGLSGNVLAAPRLDRLVVSDDDGEFLIVEDISLAWDGLALLFGRVDIRALEAARVDVQRRPGLRASASAGSSLPAIRIGRLNIGTLELAEPVLGTAANFSVSGEARLRGDGTLTLDARRTDVEGDRLFADISWQEGGDISGAFEARLAADSPLADLAGLDGTATAMTGTLSGNADSGTGTATVQMSGRDISVLELAWQDGRWTLRADTDAAQFPDRYATPFDSSSTARLTGTLSPIQLASADIEGRDWQIGLRPTAAREFDVTLSLSRTFLDSLLPDTVAIVRARFDGRLDLRAGMTLDGIAELSDLQAPGITLDAAGGGVTISRRDGATTLFAEWTATQIDFAGRPGWPSLAWAGLNIEARHTNGRIDIPALSLTSDVADVDAELTVASEDWSADGEVNLAVADISRFTGRAAGPLPVRLDITMLSPDSAALAFRADSRELVWSDARWQSVLAGARLGGRLTTDFDAWQINDLRLQGTNALATGEIGGTGTQWRALLDAAVNTDLRIGGAQLQGGAALALEAEGEGRTVNADLVVSTEQLRLAGQTLQTPRVGLDLETGPDSQRARWQAEADTRFGELVARGTAERAAGSTQIDIAEGMLGERPFTGTARFSGGNIDARLDGSDWPVGGGDIAAIALTARRDAGDWAFTADLSGAFRQSVSLSATASLADRVLATEMTGQWGDIPIRTREPVTYRFAETDRGVIARFRVGSGRANLRWTEDRQFRINLEDLPADLFVTPLDLPDFTGLLNAEVTFRERQGVWSGEAAAQATGLQLRRLPNAEPLSLAMTAALADTLDARIELSGNGLDGLADLRRSGGSVSGLGELREDARLSGTIALNGAIEPLLSLLLPETRQLAGELSVDLDVGGTVYRPVIDGEARLADGRYVSEDLGVNVQSIEGVARFDDGRLRLDSFSAQDPAGGTLTATGGAVRTDDGWSSQNRIEFTRFNAVRRPDLNVIVSGYSDVTLGDSGIAIAGEAEINRIDARPPEASAPSFAEIEVTEINHPDGRNGNGRGRLPVTLDYRIHADDNIFISGEPFSSEWRGNWEVTGAPNDLNIVGTAELINGRAYLLNRSFRLERGRVVLSGPVRSASLDLTGVHTRDNLTVNARIKGPISAPALSLSSEPTLPEDEILARLLFDQNAGQLSALQTATIAAQLSGQSIFGLVGNLRRAAGLDRLDFDTTTDGQFVVTGGQRLTDDVYLELESRGAALSSARLEWTLTPDFTLLSRLTGDTEGSIALRWRTEYD